MIRGRRLLTLPFRLGDRLISDQTCVALAADLVLDAPSSSETIPLFASMIKPALVPSVWSASRANQKGCAFFVSCASLEAVTFSNY
eukprot:3360560-Amphidinium_carterae.1